MLPPWLQHRHHLSLVSVSATTTLELGSLCRPINPYRLATECSASSKRIKRIILSSSADGGYRLLLIAPTAMDDGHDLRVRCPHRTLQDQGRDLGLYTFADRRRQYRRSITVRKRNSHERDRENTVERDRDHIFIRQMPRVTSRRAAFRKPLQCENSWYEDREQSSRRGSSASE